MSRLRAALPTFVKKLVWNMKYGPVGYPRWTPAGDVVHQLCNLAETSSILELGCGRGSLLRGLRQSGWAGHYCGVDIAKYAIDEARKAADQRSSWIVSEIESFHSPFKWDAIIMIESIYYVSFGRLSSVLERLAGMCKESGFILIRIHDLEAHCEYVEAVLRLFPQTVRLGEKLLYIGPLRAAQSDPYSEIVESQFPEGPGDPVTL